MKGDQNPKGNDSPNAQGFYAAAVALTLPSAVLVAIMAEVLSQDPVTRPIPPVPLFLLWFLAAWIVLGGLSAWITRYWKQPFSLTGYIYAVTAFVVLVTVVPNPSTIPGWGGELIGWIMVGFLVGTGLIALIAASMALVVADAASQRNQGAPRPPPPTFKERFRERAERFSRTKPP